MVMLDILHDDGMPLCTKRQIPEFLHSLGDYILFVPSLFALCIAHRFASLSTLARYNKPGLNLISKIVFFIAIRFGLIPLCYADESTVLSID